MSGISDENLRRVDARLEKWVEERTASARSSLWGAGQAIAKKAQERNTSAAPWMTMHPAVTSEDDGNAVRLTVKWRRASGAARRRFARILRGSARAVWSTWWKR